MYSNPLKVKNAVYNKFGDPFVLRFDGTYYLYPSGDNTTNEIFCYTSKDLVHFTFAGSVAKDDVLHDAFAPEVIYKDGTFYLITSPGGNGHYLYKASSPLGPFTRVSDNIKNMIDGSFFLDKNDNLYLLRANHYGISFLNINEKGETSGRVNLDARMNGRTEGPGMFYNDGFYFLTYTGNDVASTGYRVNYSYSKDFNKNFIDGLNNSILISTEGKYRRFGHSSTVLGPNLDNYYIVYHSLDINKKGVHQPRKLMIDRLNFNGSLMCANASCFSIDSPSKPDYESYGVSKLTKKSNFYFYPKKFDKFTLEAFVSFKNKIVLSYVDENNYTYLTINGTISIVEKKGNEEKELFSYKNMFKENCSHTIRVIYKDSTLEIYIDGAFIARVNLTLNPSKKGYLIEDVDGLRFNAISHNAFNDSTSEERTIAPGIIFLEGNENRRFLEKYETFAGFLKVNEPISIKLNNEKGKYLLTALVENSSDFKVEINGKVVSHDKEKSEYDFNERVLTYIYLNDNDTLTLNLLEGRFSYIYLRLRKVNKYKAVNTLKSKKYLDKYYLNDRDVLTKEIEFSFEVDKEHLYQKFGALFEASDYSDGIYQARFSIRAIFVGIISNLLVVSYFNYGEKRIYDVPIKLEKNNKIKLTTKDNLIKVYLNDELKIETIIPYMTTYGRVGLYKSSESLIKFKSFNFVEENL